MRGLSPHMRGNLTECRISGHKRGSIPAGAGEPFQGIRFARLAWVYPRTCGGTEKGLYEIADEKGLSPHVRGNQFNLADMESGIGSIPARAGEP